MNIEKIISKVILVVFLFSLLLGLIGAIGDFINKWHDLEQQKINLEIQKIINQDCKYGGTYDNKTLTLDCYKSGRP